jgi:hypothetical protein
MGSSRDRALTLTPTPTGARPPQPTRPRLQPIASSEPWGATLPWQEPPGPGDAAPASSVHSPPPPPGRQLKLLDRLREALRARHYSRRTEQSYCRWVKRFIFFHDVRHPADMGDPEIHAYRNFLTGGLSGPEDRYSPLWQEGEKWP